jgi:hypothetical protein
MVFSGFFAGKNKLLQVFGSKDIGKAIEKIINLHFPLFGKSIYIYFTMALVNWIGLYFL